jgi:tetratricopeptide (TPR) repeat protein
MILDMCRRLWPCVLVLAAACGGSLRQVNDSPIRPGADGEAGDRGPDADARGGTRQLELEPLRIEVVQKDDGTLTTEASDARSLFEEGNDALMQRRYDEALAFYDRLVADFPGSTLIGAAHYNAGIALEGKSDWAAAADRYRRAMATSPAGAEEARDAAFRLGAVLAEGKQYAAAAETFEKLLDRDDLTAEDRLEGLARLGYVLVELKDYEGAEEVLRSGLAWHKEQSQRGEIESNYFASMAQYYLAVIPHRQFRAVPLRYPEEQMGRDLEHKSELFLISYDRYMMLIDQFPNAYWTTAAIYQLGQMHKEFWDDFWAVPLPAGMSEAGVKEYVKLLNDNKEIGKLLEKSLFFHEKNVVLSRDAGIATVWVDASEVRATEVKDLLGRQQKGEMFQPGQVPGPADAAGDEGLEPRLPGTGQTTHDGTAPAEYIPGRRNL